jgi:hypothetical protein
VDVVDGVDGVPLDIRTNLGSSAVGVDCISRPFAFPIRVHSRFVFDSMLSPSGVLRHDRRGQ